MIQKLQDGERIDDIGFDGIKLIQHEDFGYGIDSVLLAAFASGETGARGIQPGSYIADIGTGSGVVAFIISHKIPKTTLVGIDIMQDAIDRATRSCKLNGLDDRIKFATMDVKDWVDLSEEQDIRFDAVVSNPPYFRKGASIPSSQESRYIARHETTAGIYDFATVVSKILEKFSSLYLVHRPDRLVDIFEALRSVDLEPKEIQMVLPREGEPANIVLIHAVKGGGPELKILPNIIVRTRNDSYTDEIMSLYERQR